MQLTKFPTSSNGADSTDFSWEEARKLLKKTLFVDQTKNAIAEISATSSISKINVYELSFNHNIKTKKEFPLVASFSYSFVKGVRTSHHIHPDEKVILLNSKHPIYKNYYGLKDYNPENIQFNILSRKSKDPLHYYVIGTTVFGIQFDVNCRQIELPGYIEFVLELSLKLLTGYILNTALETQAIILGLSRNEAKAYLDKINFIGILNGNANILYTTFGFSKILFEVGNNIIPLFGGYSRYFCDYHKSNPDLQCSFIKETTKISVPGDFNESITFYLGERDEEIRISLWSPNYSKAFVRETMQLNSVLTNLKTSFESAYKHNRLRLDAITDQDHLRKTSQTDYLTKLLNRNGFFSVCEKRLRDEQKVTLVEIDLDKFKLINDTYGHSAGDFVLRNLAKMMGDTFSRSTILSRFGGEEFYLCIPNLDYHDALIQLEHFRKRVECYFWQYKKKKEICNIPVTFSAGAVHFNVIKTTQQNDIKKMFAKWLKLADEALYEAKSNGRNVIYYCEHLKNSKFNRYSSS